MDKKHIWNPVGIQMYSNFFSLWFYDFFWNGLLSLLNICYPITKGIMFPCIITKRCSVLLNSAHMEPKKVNHAESIGLKPCPGFKCVSLLGLWKSLFSNGWIERVDWCFIFLYTGQIKSPAACWTVSCVSVIQSSRHDSQPRMHEFALWKHPFTVYTFPSFQKPQFASFVYFIDFICSD